MLGKYCIGRFILTVGVVHALFISSALAFQRSYPLENNAIRQNDTPLKPTKNSWSRGGSQQGVTNNQKPVTAKSTKQGTWFRGGVLYDAVTKDRTFVNK